MFAVVSLASVLLGTTLLPLGAPHRVVALRREHVTASPFPASVTRPNIVENGTDVVLFPLPATAPAPSGDHSVAFTPNGDAYFLAYARVTVTGEVVRATADGTTSVLNVPRADASGQIVYASGKLWMFAYRGVVSMNPDGSKQHWYDLAAKVLGGITAGPDGSIYVAAQIPDPEFKYQLLGRIFQIDRKGVVTSVSLPGLPNSIAFGGDGKLYFALFEYASGAGIGRLERDGSTSFFPLSGYENAQVQSLAYANGQLYFSGRGYVGTSPLENSFFGTVAPSGAITEYAIPGGATNTIGFLTKDFGGNLWTSIGPPASPTVFWNRLYQYNTYTGHFSGPYEVSKLGYIYEGGGPFVGPDDNIWLWENDPSGGIGSYGAYVKHVQTLEPASVSIVAGIATSFTILESHFNGPWTAYSTSPSVAVVSPSISATGEFSVTETGPGVGTIAVEDRLGNISYELVAAH